jgi:predicted amidophosphoribosyltransferase
MHVKSLEDLKKKPKKLGRATKCPDCTKRMLKVTYYICPNCKKRIPS